LLYASHGFVYLGNLRKGTPLSMRRHPPKLAHPSGVEPEPSANKRKGIVIHAHKNAHKNCIAADSSLQKVITAWDKLPAPLKAAILAIVNSTEDVP
jgi:hypothetical protein